MDILLLLARLVLAGVFLVAGTAKLADRHGSVRALGEFGVPPRFAAPLGIALPVTEILVALTLLPVATARWGALGALLLLIAFVTGIGITMARGNAPDCHCFGQLHSEPVGSRTLVRNGGLLAMAAFLLVAGWNNPGPSTVAWISDLSAFELLMLVGGLVMAALLAVQGWVLFHILRQNGRLLLRLDALENTAGTTLPLQATGSVSQESASGLVPGTAAPAFSLPNIAGGSTTLSDLLAPGSPTLLMFSDSGCGPCNALLPEIGKWQQEHGGRFSLAVISRGSMEANRSKASEHGIRTLLLQRDREVATAYQVISTPSAVLVRPDGTIGSRVVAGPDAIRWMVDAIVGASPSAPMRNGHGAPSERPNLVGQPVPEVSLLTVDDEQVELSAYLAGPTALLLWNPGCGHCQRMLNDLTAFLADPPAGAPKLVVISGGDVERNRAQGIDAPVLLDRNFATGRQLGATGTPSAVLIDGAGDVASPLAVGATAILRLLGAIPQEVGSAQEPALARPVIGRLRP